MAHRIEIGLRQDLPDPIGKKVRHRISHDLGVHVEAIRSVDGYIIDKDLSKEDLDIICEEVFRDPVIQIASVDDPIGGHYDWLIEVGFRPGVTDNVARTARECVERTLNLKFTKDEGVYTRRLYFITGRLDRATVEGIAKDLLANELIQTWRVYANDENRAEIKIPKVSGEILGQVNYIDLEMSDDDLVRMSKEGALALNLEEMKAIRQFFSKDDYVALRETHGLEKGITDCELEVLAQTWSEHCKHKIFNATILYRFNGESRTIKSLFKTYVQGSTEKIRKELGPEDFCLSVFKDNAGVIKFDDQWSLVFKVETHNSPSALDPYGGALTGIVGVNRDPFGTGQGSKLIFNTDVFCFAPPDFSGAIPERLLHPRRVFEGVREGVEHGGNKSGIPTINGAVVFDNRYLGKPLVYCGTGGICPAEINGRPGHDKSAKVGDLIVMTGGRIGKDGIHGATFSSEELHEDSPVSAVQIGDPITQKRMTDFLLAARDRGLYNSITDNGAGGLSSSVGEMAQESGGAILNLEAAPLKYPGLQPWEILLSEAQERMTVAVPPDKIDEFLSLARFMDVEATVLGEFNESGFFQVKWHGDTAALLPLDFLHNGLPEMKLNATWIEQVHEAPIFDCPSDLGGVLIDLLGRWNICSKESLIRQYDHEVQGGSVVKPLVGETEDGPGDAAVIRPLLDRFRGVAVGCGIAPRYSDIDTYWMMAASIDEAVRNIVSVGANPDHMAGLDNFCWCDPVQSEKTPDGEYKLAQLVRANEALFDITTVYKIPCISGKDSMKNDYNIAGEKISIPPTVLFSAMGIVPDVRLAVTSDFKAPGHMIYILGITRDELGASEYYASMGYVGETVPKVVSPEETISMYRDLHKAIMDQLIASCHDCSDGGLGVALAESCFSGGVGAEIDLSAVPVVDITRDDTVLFSETPSRFVISVSPENRGDFEQSMSRYSLARIGETNKSNTLKIHGLSGATVVNKDILKMKKAWQAPLGT